MTAISKAEHNYYDEEYKQKEHIHSNIILKFSYILTENTNLVIKCRKGNEM